jgi:hypothetical protein
LEYRHLAAQFAGQGRWLAPALTLLDKETGFFRDGDPETGEEIRFLSGAPRVSLEQADFVFLSAGGNYLDGNSGPAGQDEPLLVRAARILARVKAGTHLDPHESALLFIASGEDGAGETTKEEAVIKGPGVPPEGRRIDLLPAEAAWCRARDERGFEYPCGIELIFLREECSLLAITRKTGFSWKRKP